MKNTWLQKFEKRLLDVRMQIEAGINSPNFTANFQRHFIQANILGLDYLLGNEEVLFHFHVRYDLLTKTVFVLFDHEEKRDVKHHLGSSQFYEDIFDIAVEAHLMAVFRAQA